MEYDFTVDWFSMHETTWMKYLGHLRDEPIDALEIGSFEGRSAVWLIDNILVHPKSNILCVDPFEYERNTPDLFGHNWDETAAKQVMLDAQERFKRNTHEHFLKSKLLHNDRTSIRFFKELPYWRKFDLIYVDGAHRASAVLHDTLQSFMHLALGGILILDDYLWVNESSPNNPETAPKLAIDAFLTCFTGTYEILHQEWQVILRRTK